MSGGSSSQILKSEAVGMASGGQSLKIWIKMVEGVRIKVGPGLNPDQGLEEFQVKVETEAGGDLKIMMRKTEM